MIFATMKVYTPEGWREARSLQPGDQVYSWRSKAWVKNTVARVNQGQSRTALAIVALDGIAPTVFHCTPDQEILRGRSRYVKAGDLEPGATVIASEGSHVFKCEIGMMELMESIEPQPMIGLELDKKPWNFLAGGFICH